MKVIKNSKELAKLVNEYKDLILPNENVRIEFEPTIAEIRNVECRDLFMMNDNEKFNFNGGNLNGRDFKGLDFNGLDFNGRDFKGFNFNGGDFNGGDFNGVDFNGWDFNGGNFNGRDFNGGNFNGRDFDGKKISYYAIFMAYNSIKCTSWVKRRENALDPICLDGKLEIITEEDDEIQKAIKLLEDKGKLKDGKILTNQ